MNDEVMSEMVGLARDQVDAIHRNSREIGGLSKALLSLLAELEPIVPGITDRTLGAVDSGREVFDQEFEGAEE